MPEDCQKPNWAICPYDDDSEDSEDEDYEETEMLGNESSIEMAIGIIDSASEKIQLTPAMSGLLKKIKDSLTILDEKEMGEDSAHESDQVIYSNSKQLEGIIQALDIIATVDKVVDLTPAFYFLIQNIQDVLENIKVVPDEDIIN